MPTLSEADTYKLLHDVKNHFTDNYSTSYLANIWGIGPITQNGSGNNVDCFILVDPGADPALPQPLHLGWTVNCIKRNGRRRSRNINGPDNALSRRSLVQASLSGLAGMGVAAVSTPPGEAATPSAATPSNVVVTVWICPPPLAPPGPLMGGDAIYNVSYLDVSRPHHTFWGTIAFVAGAGAKAKFNGSTIDLSNRAVSCAHVLFHKNGGSIQTTRFTSGITFGEKFTDWPDLWPDSPPAVAKGWPDIANATVAVSTVPKMIRALGQLAGVAKPEVNDVVAKYGATTGLTVARDAGMVWLRLPDVAGDFFMVRAVTGRFCRSGDSGAAVVFAGEPMSNPKYRKLAGFVLAGSDEENEQYYLPALEWGGVNSFADLSAIEIML